MADNEKTTEETLKEEAGASEEKSAEAGPADGTEAATEAPEGAAAGEPPAQEPIETEEPTETEETVAEADPLKETEAKLAAAETAAKEAHDRMLRHSAELDNYKKRSQREMVEFRKFANEALIKELLSVVDNLERAIASSPADNAESDCMMEGVDLTLKEILKVFEKFSVKPVDAEGKPFDPNFHQAVMQEPSDEHPEGTVLTVLQKGYLLHDRLIRPAMVVVSKAKA